MCKTMDYANQLEVTYGNIINRNTFLRNKLGELDKAELDILHKIENDDKVNIVQGYDFYKAIHDLRIARRKIKNEIEISESLNCKILSTKGIILDAVVKAKGLESKKNYLTRNKTYNPKQLKLEGDIRVEIKKLIEGVI